MPLLRNRLTLLALTLLAWLAPALQAQPLVFRRLDVPFLGATGTIITGAHAGALVGLYTDREAQPQAFIRPRCGRLYPLLGITVKGISAAGITGFYQPLDGSLQAGFVLFDGALRRLRVPQNNPPGLGFLTEAVGITKAGLVVGDYRGADGVFRGFLYTPTTDTYTTIEAPGATHTAVTGVDNQGRLVGRFVDAGGPHAFRWESGTLTVVTIPTLPPDIELVGRTEAGVLAGNHGDHGFTWDGTTVTTISVPGATQTTLTGIREDGTVYGHYEDATGRHGFVATPADGEFEEGEGLSSPLGP